MLRVDRLFLFALLEFLDGESSSTGGSMDLFRDIERRRQAESCGILPTGCDSISPCDKPERLDGLIAVWEAAAITRPLGQQRRIRRLIGWLRTANPHVEQITGALSFDRSGLLNSEIGMRLLWTPQGLPQVPVVAIASSHIGRDEAFQNAWLHEFLQLAERARDRGQAMLTVAGTTTARFVERWGRTNQQPVVVLHVASQSRKGLSWFEAVTRWHAEAAGADSSNVFRVFVSPTSDAISEDARGFDEALPIADLALCYATEALSVISVRERGSVAAILKQRLGRNAPLQLSLPSSSLLISEAMKSSLAGDPRITWRSSVAVSDGASASQESTTTVSTSCASTRRSAATEVWNRSGDWPYLTHWTRGLSQVSIQRVDDETLDELLQNPERRDRSGLGALKHILRSGELVASRLDARNPVPTVSFTAAPWWEWPELRAYRPHRTRWDFEPYGLCIKRDVLWSLGVRHVRYVSREELDRATNEDRTWLQLASSRLKTREIDWSLEREWRHLGRLSLSWLSDDDAFAFVRTEAEAQELAPLCRFPVLVVPSSDCLRTRSECGFVSDLSEAMQSDRQRDSSGL